MWASEKTGKRFRVPRHKTEDVPKGTLKLIMEAAGLIRAPLEIERNVTIWQSTHIRQYSQGKKEGCYSVRFPDVPG